MQIEEVISIRVRSYCKEELKCKSKAHNTFQPPEFFKLFFSFGERPKESSEHTQPLSASAVRFFADWSAVPRPSTGVKKYRCARFKVDSVPTVPCKSP